MANYTIVPRGRGYWIEAVDVDGSRRTIERYGTEEEAVRRLHILQEAVGVVKPKYDPIPPRDRYR
jgi:hypothetical protein